MSSSPDLLRRRLLGATLLAPLPGLPLHASAASAPLRMVNAVHPPFVNPSDHPRGEGIDIEIAREALRRGGDYRFELELLPWKRALLMLERGEADLTTTISRNGDRDRYLAWSSAYRLAAGYSFFARPGSRPRLEGLEGLAGKTIGVLAGYFYPPNIVEQAGVVLEPARTPAQLAQKLGAGRADLIVISTRVADVELREQELARQIERQPYQYPASSPNYMAFSKLRPHAQPLAAMEAGLASMARDGSLRRIEQKYL
ncbi:substrate-binding periplasmic protein [Roseateles violae]|uniref:Transporter substrate-binding domain-containing protein n=1 Tax=Roseateles violae TaxID=3058042 RepID=A0ABT8DMW6_9BURK|nr:transporter substrate-binding domain-containing protein [Pelomonas sp. PFR6]MDN3919278.1 transporter substrate-binding domain-containing protein [Pelomonas sp. PFR6]